MTASAQQSRTFIPVKAGKAPHCMRKTPCSNRNITQCEIHICVWADWLLCRLGTKSEEDKGNKSLHFTLQVFSFTKSVMNQFTQLSPSCLFILVVLMLVSMTTLHNDWEGNLRSFTESWETRSLKSFDSFLDILFSKGPEILIIYLNIKNVKTWLPKLAHQLCLPLWKEIHCSTLEIIYLYK